MAWINSQIAMILEREDDALHEAELVREAIHAPTFSPVEGSVSSKLQEMRLHLQRVEGEAEAPRAGRSFDQRSSANPKTRRSLFV